MLKHIGRHGDRKVAIVFREIPGEDHMCLVIYPDVLPTPIHDTVMKVLESPVGQQESVLADALHRNLLPDGRAILEALHKEGMLKKVSTEHIIMTPTANSNVRLDELNRLVREMEQGEGARKRMAELDASTGLVDPQTKRRAEAEFKSRQQQKTTTASDTLDDKTLATNMLSQAKRMEVEARGLIAEAARMKKDAERMFPGVMVTDTITAATPAETKTRGRKRAVAADAVQ
jgi:hypothetical protein